MTENKIKRRGGYSTIPNAMISDASMSIEARGLLALLMSMSENWTFRTANLMEQCGVGKEKYQRMIREIKSSGYLSITEHRNDLGHICHEWEIIDEPRAGLPASGEPTPVKQAPIDKTKEVKTNKDTPKPPEGADDLFSANEKTVQPDETDVLFDRFWKVFPKKAGKPSARKAFEKAIKRAPAEIIIQRATRYAEWLSEASATEFRPHPKHPQGWLNDDRWEAEELLVASVGTPRRESYTERMARILRETMQ